MTPETPLMTWHRFNTNLLELKELYHDRDTAMTRRFLESPPDGNKNRKWLEDVHYKMTARADHLENLIEDTKERFLLNPELKESWHRVGDKYSDYLEAFGEDWANAVIHIYYKQTDPEKRKEKFFIWELPEEHHTAFIEDINKRFHLKELIEIVGGNDDK